MHWNSFFDDLEGHIEQDLFEDEQRRSQVEERFRLSTITLRDRIAAVGGVELGRAERPIFQVIQPGLGTIRMRLITLGRDWFSADWVGKERKTQIVMSIAQLGTIISTSPFPIPVIDLNDPHLVSRISFGFFLRDLARRRVPVRIYWAIDEPVVGTIDQVSRDHIELVRHDASGRKPGEQELRMLIRLSHIYCFELA